MCNVPTVFVKLLLLPVGGEKKFKTAGFISED